MNIVIYFLAIVLTISIGLLSTLTITFWMSFKNKPNNYLKYLTFFISTSVMDTISIMLMLISVLQFGINQFIYILIFAMYIIKCYACIKLLDGCWDLNLGTKKIKKTE